MRKFRNVIYSFFIITSLILSGCGEGKSFEQSPLVRASPTSTLLIPITPTYTPIKTVTPSSTFTLPPTYTYTSTPVIGGGSGKIAFEQWPHDSVSWQSVRIINSDGSGLFQVAGGTMQTYFKSWFPDGKKIVYYDEDKYRFFSINIDGTEARQIELDFWLGTSLTVASSFVISPDGTKVAFTLDLGNLTYDLYVADFDGEKVSRPIRLGIGHNPNWCADGNEIVYDDNAYLTQIFSINLKSSRITNLSRLIKLDGSEAYPSCSPDGSKIVFTNFHRGVEGSLKLSILDLGNNTVNDLGAYGIFANWSPDGNKIIYTDYPSIYMIDTNGSNMYLFYECEQCMQATWAPK